MANGKIGNAGEKGDKKRKEGHSGLIICLAMMMRQGFIGVRVETSLKEGFEGGSGSGPVDNN